MNRTLRARIRAAANALRGRPTVAFVDLHGELHLAATNRHALVVGTRITPA